jgi:hypothetical protein
MKNKKITIVGGGIVGFITANYLLAKGVKDISIYELKNNLGGVLKDEIFNNDFFFNSCQYLDVQSEYYKYIPQKIRKDLYEFDHEYFSVTKLKTKKIFTKNFAGPVFDEMPLFKKNVDLSKNLHERLNIYPAEVSSFLINWVKSAFKNIQKLTSNSSYSLAIRRAFFRNFTDDVKKKKILDYVDETYGLPRDILKLSSIKAALPKKGFNDFFLQFEKYLISQGVNVYKKSPIKTLFLKKKINIYNGLKKINFNHLIWTGNPNPIIKNTIKKKLDSYNIEITSYYFIIKKNIKKNFYIQVFSLETRINRIFFYYDGNSNKITVECFDHKFDQDTIQKEVLENLKYLNLNITNKDLVFSGYTKLKNYSIISINDFQTLYNFRQIQDKFKLIDCGWYNYGRDIKLNKVFESINKYILT